jgi:hypothetical protein
MRLLTYKVFNINYSKQCGIYLLTHTCHNNLSRKCESNHSWTCSPSSGSFLTHKHLYLYCCCHTQRDPPPDHLVRKTFDTRSRSNPSSNHQLWYHSWVTMKGKLRGSSTLGSRTTLQVSWTPRFNPKPYSVRFMGFLTYKVFNLFNLHFSKQCRIYTSFLEIKV